MQVKIRRLGNSRGILIPKLLLKQVGFTDEVELQVEGNTLVLRKRETSVRVGWAEASKRIASIGDDSLVLPEFANEADSELKW